MIVQHAYKMERTQVTEPGQVAATAKSLPGNAMNYMGVPAPPRGSGQPHGQGNPGIGNHWMTQPREPPHQSRDHTRHSPHHEEGYISWDTMLPTCILLFEAIEVSEQSCLSQQK